MTDSIHPMAPGAFAPVCPSRRRDALGLGSAATKVVVIQFDLVGAGNSISLQIRYDRIDAPHARALVRRRDESQPEPPPRLPPLSSAAETNHRAGGAFVHRLREPSALALRPPRTCSQRRLRPNRAPYSVQEQPYARKTGSASYRPSRSFRKTSGRRYLKRSAIPRTRFPPGSAAASSGPARDPWAGVRALGLSTRSTMRSRAPMPTGLQAAIFTQD